MKVWKHILGWAISFGLLPSAGIIFLKTNPLLLHHISLEIYICLIVMYLVAFTSFLTLISALRRNNRGTSLAVINATIAEWYRNTTPPLRLVETKTPTFDQMDEEIRQAIAASEPSDDI
jgi:hypothetical protein